MSSPGEQSEVIGERRDRLDLDYLERSAVTLGVSDLWKRANKDVDGESLAR